MQHCGSIFHVRNCCNFTFYYLEKCNFALSMQLNKNGRHYLKYQLLIHISSVLYVAKRVKMAIAIVIRPRRRIVPRPGR